MNREIKFLCWDTEIKDFLMDHQYWINQDGKVFLDDGYDPPLDISLFDKRQDRFILIQYTGLKDKNGKEIYEGYFVKDITGNYDYDETPFLIKYQELNNCGCCTLDSGIGFNFLKSIANNIEVVGNIFQNPELLEKTDA